MRVKEESEKAVLKLNIKTAKIIASSSITSWQIDGKKMKTVAYFIFFVSQISEESKNMSLNSTFRKQKSWHPVPSLHGK